MAVRGRAAIATAPRSFVLDLTHGLSRRATWPGVETVGAATHRPDRKGPNGPCHRRARRAILPRSARAGVGIRAKGFSVSNPDRSVQATGGFDFRVLDTVD